MKKIAVIMFNLGGPDSKDSIKPFLYNFFTDPNIIPLPRFLRSFIAWRISSKRSRKEAGISYGFLGGQSPLLANSQAQADALDLILNGDTDYIYKSFICMRYWHPMADDVVRDVQRWGADEIFILPLYPQFSTTTTWSSLGAWNNAAQRASLNLPTTTLCCYPFNDAFIAASVDHIRKVYTQAVADGYSAPRLLFSAHGLPESIIKKGDPYQWQCEEGAKKMAAALNIPDLDWAICYQSRVGPMAWIGPSTEQELARAARDQKAVILYPHAFTQEHVETLVEIEIEYREKAEGMGIHGFYRVPTVSVNPVFIDGLAQLVRDHQHKSGVFGEGGHRICPENFKRCCMNT